MRHDLWDIKKALVRKAWMAGFGLLMLGSLACSFFSLVPGLAATPSPLPVPGPDELRFKDPETGRRFNELNTAINSFVDKNWGMTPYQLSGNFYEAAWCSGAEANCQRTDAIFERRDQHLLELYTLFYDADFPEVFGLGFHAAWVPTTTGWGASFGFSEGGDSIVADGWQVIFQQYLSPAGAPDATLSLGQGDSYKIYETTIQYISGKSVRDDLAPYLAGPDAMREQGLKNLRAFAEQVRNEISTNQVLACDLEPYQGNGIPPACKPRSMTAAEKISELARAEADFAVREQLLSDHYQEMYAAWMQAFPVERFWGPATIQQ